MAHIPHVYANTTITSTGISSGAGLTYTSGTGVQWQSPSTDGTISAKDVNINGRSLNEAIQALEERLNILVPNPELEKEWDQLKQLGDQYRKLEKDLTEKAAMWKALKKV